MAQNDVVSVTHISIAGSSTSEVVPASGDEWSVTHLFSGGGGSGTLAIQAYDGSSANDMEWMPTGGNTAISAFATNFGGVVMQLLITENQRIRLRNGSGSTQTAAYSAIKTKD